MPASAATPYDEVLYPGLPYAQTHPDRLATIAFLHGLKTAPVCACRVLELGCGMGANLIPIAYQWPQSRFVGIDLSARSIAIGAAEIAALGLANIELKCLDLCDAGADLGSFDYIIAHGVYAWVPAPVRERLLAVIGACLAPRGVAYVSYNCLPGGHLRAIASDILQYHGAGIAEPRARIAAVRQALQNIAQAASADTVYGIVLRAEADRIARKADEVLFHDDMEQAAQPLSLDDLLTAAAPHDLCYLAEAKLAHATLAQRPAPVVTAIESIPAENRLAREQYLDFIEGRGFRETLLCRAEAAPRWRDDPALLWSLHIAAEARPAEDGADPAGPGIVRFTMGSGGTVALDHRLSKAALIELDARFPRALAFDELVAAALQRLAADATAVRQDIAAETEALATVMWRAALAGHIDLSLCPPRLAETAGEYPQASLVARRQALTGALVTNLRHIGVRLEDAAVRRFLTLVDGTRDANTLARDLAALAPPSAGSRDDLAGAVRDNLAKLARLALLVG